MKTQITKSYLEYLGITEVTEDGRVFTKNGELKTYLKGGRNKRAANQLRLTVYLHDSEKYKSIPKEKRNRSSGHVTIGVHKVVYAWFHNEIPYGKEVHHIDLNYLNNAKDNLEALTPEEHRQLHKLLKGSNPEEKCRLDIPREHYVKKIAEYEAKGAYNNAAQYKRRLKYYDNHIEEVTKVTEFQKDKAELAYFKKCFKDEGNKAMWHECCKVEKVAKASSIDDAQMIIKHALEVIHRHFGR